MSRNIWRRLTSIVAAIWLSLALPTIAFAHPLGNFTINHYAGLNISREAITIDYVLDMAEIPAFQEIGTFDANGNGKPDDSETTAYHPAKCDSLRSDLDLRVDGHSTGLTLASSSIEFPHGIGGLATLRLTCTFNAPLANRAGHVSFIDNTYMERIGWREIVVTSDKVGLQGDFASTSISQRLTSYPADMLSNPLDQREISFEIKPTSIPAQHTSSSTLKSTSTLVNTREDAFTRLITLENLTLPTILFALAVSFVWGAMHALTPGHGKAVVGSYLIGERGTARHALLLGMTTTITHTAGVFAMGLVTLLAAQFITPEQLFPWLSFLSGALVAGIGLNMFFKRLRGVRSVSPPHFEMAHVHDDGPVHQHTHHDHHGHSHHHEHQHHQDHSHDAGHAHSHHDHHNHDHHEHTHSHLPPETVTWKSILALGISGGILPCPSALIVLLSAIALGRIGFGLALVLAFSAGLAGVLTAIGLLFVYARKLIEFTPKRRWVFKVLPVASALVISLAGLGITVQALSQIGWISL